MHERIIQEAPKLGHALHGAEVIRPGGSSALLVCLRCGAFAEAGDNPALHSSRCNGPTSKHGWEQVRRAKRGHHPRTGAVGQGAVLTGLVPVS